MKKSLLIILGIISLIALASLAYYIFTKPSHQRNWEEGVSRLPHATISDANQKITIENVRDWHYDKNGPIQKEWITREFDIKNITDVWFVVSRFSETKGIAHTMFVFDFKNQDPVAVSVEARKEVGEKYSPFWGMFRRFELTFVWGNETDLLGKRFIDNDQLYMFPLDINLEYAQTLFINLVEETNEIYQKPQFYNTLTNNCTNVLADSANTAREKTVPWHISRILPGYSDEFLYKLGYIKLDDIPEAQTDFENIAEHFYINDIIKNIDKNDYANFSEIIRKRLSIDGA